jgi:hypothetical protein
MEEKDIFWLEGQGYTYNPNGYILDNAGNFVKSVQKGDRTLYSDLDEIDYKEELKTQAKLKELGFVPEENTGTSVLRQELDFIYKHKVKQHIKYPDSIKLDLNNSLNKYWYDKIIKETNLEEKIKKEKDSIALVRKNKIEEIQFNKKVEVFVNTGSTIIIVLLIILTIKKILK